MKLLPLFLLLALRLSAATTLYYVDPDYTGGANDGSAAHPWTTVPTAANWTNVNTSLASGDVTIYFSARKANTSQQSKAWFIEVKRYDPSANRLTLDGYAYYNSNISTPNWLANPNTNIASAYTNNQVFESTSDGSLALGWSRLTGQDKVTSGGNTYTCIKSHVSAAGSQPGVGANWAQYWDQHDTGGSAWVTATAYSCYVKQDNVTIRGFECNGGGSRVGFSGDNFKIEYVWVHDLTSGASVSLLYTSYPDSSAAQIIAAPSTNITIKDLRIENSQGEAIYVGAINPDATETFQCLHGNQYDQVYITNFFISAPGTGSGQGDGIDCKNGITHLVISNGEIGGNIDALGAIVCPQTFDTANNQNLMIERVYIHNVMAGTDDRNAIYMQSSINSQCTKGYNGVTVRNCIISNCKAGIESLSVGVLKNIRFYNNTIYSTTDVGIEADSTDGTIELKNNLLLSNNGGGSQVAFSGSNFDSATNAYDNTWTGTCSGCISSAATSDLVSVGTGNFTLLAGKPEVDAGTALASVSIDFIGTARPQTTWDIGAYELLPAEPVFVRGVIPIGGLRLKK